MNFPIRGEDGQIKMVHIDNPIQPTMHHINDTKHAEKVDKTLDTTNMAAEIPVSDTPSSNLGVMVHGKPPEARNIVGTHGIIRQDRYEANSE